jgi:hypothetical protein
MVTNAFPEPSFVFQPFGLLTKAVSTSVSGDTVMIAGTTNQRIYVFRVLLAGQQTGVTIKSGTTILAGPMNLAGMVLDLDYAPQRIPWWVTEPGDSLIINLGNAVPWGGTLWYQVQ